MPVNNDGFRTGLPPTPGVTNPPGPRAPSPPGLEREPPGPASDFRPGIPGTPDPRTEAVRAIQETLSVEQGSPLTRAQAWVQMATPALRARSELLFLNDANAKLAQVLVRQGAQAVFNPMTSEQHPDVRAALSANPTLTLAGGVPASTAARVFATPPGSPERTSVMNDLSIPPAVQETLNAGPTEAAGYTQAEADADAKTLYDATEGGLTGWGTDEDALWKTLADKSPADIALLRQSYQDQYGKTLDDVLASELSGDDLTRARSALAGHESKTVDGALTIADELGSFNTDEEKILGTLEDATPAERQQIALTFARMKGGPTDSPGAASVFMLSQLAVTLDGEEMGRASALLAASNAATPEAALSADASADAGKLHEAIAGWGTDEDSIKAALDGKTQAQVDAIASAYQQKYGESLGEALRGEADNAGERDVFNRYLHPADADDPQARADASAEKIEQAVSGIGTDEDAIRAELRGKSKAQIDLIAASYQAKYGEDLRSRLDSELSGRDTVELLEQLFDRGDVDPGAPGAAQERLDRIQQQHAAEGGFGDWLTTSIQSLTKGSDQTDEARYQLHAGEAQRAIDGGDDAAAARRDGFAAGDLASLQGSKDELAGDAAFVVEMAAAMTATALTGGAGAGLVGVAAAGIGAGAAAGAGTYAAIEGRAADVAEVWKNAAVGAMTGATSAFMPAAAVAGAGEGAASVAARSALSWAKVGSATGAVSGAGKEILEGANVGHVLGGALEGAVIGAVKGAAGGSTLAVAKKLASGDE